MVRKKIPSVTALLLAAGLMFGATALAVGRSIVPAPNQAKGQPVEGKDVVFKGKLESVRGSWFQGEHQQRGMTVVGDDNAMYVLYFGPEERQERIREALKQEGAMVVVTGRFLSPERAAKIHNVASGPNRRILEVKDVRFGENIDPERAVRVPVVLRVKWLRGGAAKSIAMEEVEILSVLKNTSGQVFNKSLLVGRANVEKGADLPQQACTIYLQESEDARKNRYWTLLNLNLDQGGVSHVAAPGGENK